MILVRLSLLFKKLYWNEVLSVDSVAAGFGRRAAELGVRVPRYLLRIHQFVPSETSVTVFRVELSVNAPAVPSITLSNVSEVVISFVTKGGIEGVTNKYGIMRNVQGDVTVSILKWNKDPLHVPTGGSIMLL